MKVCEVCGEIFTNNKVYSNHIRWKHREVSKITCTDCGKTVTCHNYKKHIAGCQKLLTNLKYCKECNNVITVKYNQFCNQSCFAVYNNKHRSKIFKTEEWRAKLRLKAIESWNRGTYDFLLNKSNIFTSKVEREIVKHFKTNYKEDEWKSGGRVKLNSTTYLSRDLWSDKLKICFEYDGIWHFKDIHNQLALKQQKDLLLKEWCKQNSYRLIRIDEDKFIDVYQIEELIYRNNKQFIYIGDRYN